jgi:hypothetical protein
MLNLMQISIFAPRLDVRFGSKADISQCNQHVRLTPKSDRSCDLLFQFCGRTALTVIEVFCAGSMPPL